MLDSFVRAEQALVTFLLWSKAMRYIFCIVFVFLALAVVVSAFAVTTYEIEVAHNDEFFIINGEKSLLSHKLS